MATLTEEIPQALVAETRAACRELERVLATQPAVNEQPPEASRRARREGTSIFPPPVYLPQARMLEIEGAAGRLPLRVIPPDGEPTGGFLHLHGGGWTLGECDMQDLRLQRVADDTGLVVVSVGYRLAPEHPYPAGPDDCEAAALWLLDHRDSVGLSDDQPLAMGGDSAGGHLTAATLLRLRDRDAKASAFSAAVFQYGAFDLSMTPSQRRWGERNLVLSTPIIAWFGDQFLPGRELEARRDPDISPLYADLTGLPPAIFTVGTADALLDDTLFMEARWRAAGNETELRVWPEAPHGFVSLPMAIADLALTAEHAFLRHTLGLPAR
jgi:acetyl esterase